MGSGDLFRLFTQDKEEYPLPHPLLLGVHAMVAEMADAAGVEGVEGGGGG